MTVRVSDTRYSRARNGPTPAFVDLCKTLYGDLIDPEMVWDDVLKASPDQADMNAQKGSFKRKALKAFAVGGTIAGGGLAAAELGGIPRVAGKLGGIPGAVRAVRGGASVGSQITPKLAMAGLGGAADVAAVGEMTRKKPQGQLQPTGYKAKADFGGALPRIKESVKGLRGHFDHMAHGLPKAGEKIPKHEPLQEPPTARSSRTQSAGKNLYNAVSTPAGRTGIGLGVAGTTAVVGANKARKSSAQSQGYDEYGKRLEDVVWKGEFSKLDEDKHLAFGWATVVELNGVPVLDKQGDIIEPEEIEKAAYDYVINSRVGGNMHKRDDMGRFAKVSTGQPYKVSDMVESMVFTDDKVAKMGLPDDFPRGWWVGFKVHDPQTWEQVKKRERTGFSIHGKGIRRDVDYDEAMGYANAL